MSIQLINGGNHIDDRGEIQFVNEFTFPDVKRFYIIKPKFNQVRAWQGHRREHKYFFVSHGSFLVCTVRIDDWGNPSPDLKVNATILTEEQPTILAVPSGHVNGFKSLQENSTLIVFSNLSLEDSLKDDFRFDKTLWFDWDEDKNR